MADRNRVLTGARARLLIRNKTVGWVTDFSVTESIEYQETNVLDLLEVYEHVPVGYRVRCNFGTLTIVGKSLKELGFFPKGGESRGARLKNILDLGDLSLGIEDNQTTTVQYVVTGLKIGENTVSIQAGSISGTQVTCVAKAIKDASEL